MPVTSLSNGKIILLILLLTVLATLVVRAERTALSRFSSHNHESTHEGAERSISSTKPIPSSEIPVSLTDEVISLEKTGEQKGIEAPVFQNHQDGTGISNEKFIVSPLYERSNQDEPPKFGVEVKNEVELDKLMSQINVWGFDIFKLDYVSLRHPLTVVMFKLFEIRNLFEIYNISRQKFISYMLAVEALYHNNPYHNRIHAADVVQSNHVLLSSPKLASVFTDLEIMSALFAAAVHDVDHPGVSNQFLIDSGNELAIKFKNESVLENHSLDVAFKLFQKDSLNFLENLNQTDIETFKQLTVDLVLATDMSKHLILLSDLRTIINSTKISNAVILMLGTNIERTRVLQGMLHCADLGNPTKPTNIYRQWVYRIMEEFYRQGDKERLQNLKVSPMCDRMKADIDETQVNFIDYIAQPLWTTWADLVYPDAEQMLNYMKQNRDMYTKRPNNSEIKYNNKSSTDPNKALDENSPSSRNKETLNDDNASNSAFNQSFGFWNSATQLTCLGLWIIGYLVVRRPL